MCVWKRVDVLSIGCWLLGDRCDLCVASECVAVVGEEMNE